jgi:hypothetical protein
MIICARECVQGAIDRARLTVGFLREADGRSVVLARLKSRYLRGASVDGGLSSFRLYP